MARYRCYFLGVNGKILVAEDIDASSDVDALDRARQSFSQWPMFPTFELWQGDNRIHKEGRNKPAA